MAEGTALQQFAFVEMPTAGLIASLQLTAGQPGYLDLSTFDWNGVPQADVMTRLTQGAVNTYVSIAFVGTLGYLCAGPTVASVTGANAPNPGATGTNQPGIGWPVPALDTTGQIARFKVRKGFNQLLGFVGVNNGTITVYRSGPPGEGGL